jgi:hypothetical protein
MAVVIAEELTRQSDVGKRQPGMQGVRRLVLLHFDGFFPLKRTGRPRSLSKAAA